MIIGLIQMLCEKAAIDANLEFMEREIARADALGADLVAFPEMSITGYVDPARYPGAVLALEGPVVARFLQLTAGRRATVLGGIIEENAREKPYITQLIARDGALVGQYRKRTIVDEESEWFAPGSAVPVFEHDGVTCGVAICADIENETVFRDAWEQGADLILHVAAPGLHGDQSSRNWVTGYQWWEGLCNYLLSDHARQLGCWIAVATQAGRATDEDFPGGAFLFDPSGQRVYSTKDWAPCSVYLNVDLDTQSVTVITEARDGS